LQSPHPTPPHPQYYHAHTGLPVADEELAYDSGDDVDTAWRLQHSHRTLDEFIDVG
jgi:hypothetical protein